MTAKIFFIRTYYKIINPWRRLYWFLVRPKTRGVKCVVIHDGRILLEKISYAHKKWTIPGGGVRRRETFEQAVKREIAEELGVVLTDVIPIGNYMSTKEYKRDTVECFLAFVADLAFTIDPQEVTDAGWFTLDALPQPHTPSVERLIAMYRAYTEK